MIKLGRYTLSIVLLALYTMQLQIGQKKEKVLY